MEWMIGIGSKADMVEITGQESGEAAEKEMVGDGGRKGRR